MTIASETDAAGERIVVGVDGSPDARQALEWAITHAGPTDTIDIVHTWHQPIMAVEAGMAIDSSVLAESAAAVLQRELHLLQSRLPDLPTITPRAINGHAGQALLEAAEGADLLVVGTRGHGGFTGLLLGSTSTYLAHHSPCPLVIVPAPEQDE